MDEWLGGWMEIKLNYKKVGNVMADNPALRGDIWRLDEVCAMQSAGFLLVDLKISSSGMSNLLPPPWPLTVPSFPPAFTLFYLEDCSLCVDRVATLLRDSGLSPGYWGHNQA